MAKNGKNNNQPTMNALIVSTEKGVEEYEDINVIRIQSSDYNLLIMEGYAPCIGAIEGTVTLVSEKEAVKLENIRGFFLHKKNIFRLMLREDGTNVG